MKAHGFVVRFWPAALLAASLAAGCGEDPAPPSITDISRWIYLHYDRASDGEMADAVVSLAGATAIVTPEEPLKGLLSPLQAGDNLVVGRQGVDATRAIGMTAITDIACRIGQVERIHSAAEQNTLHPGAYTAYSRVFRQSRDDYLAGTIALLDWDTDLTSDFAREKVVGSIRRIPDLGKERSPYGMALASRTWLTEDGVPVSSNTQFQQDYHAEIYFERSPGRVVHMFSFWREATFYGISEDNDILQNIQLNALVDWDKEVEAACASGNY